MIKFVFPEMLGEEKNKILKILEKGEMNDMQDLIERIKENEARIKGELIRKGVIQGKTEGIIEMMLNVIKNMLQQNEDEEKIMRYTNARREDIEKVKKQLNMN